MKLLKKPKEPYIRNIGTVKIETMELLNLLKDYDFPTTSNVIIKNKDYEFGSIEEAKKNHELLIGQPKFKIQTSENSVKLDFREGLTLRLENTNNQEEIIIFDKLCNTLEVYRTPFYFLRRKFILAVLLVLLVLNTVSLHFFQSVSDIYEKNELYVLIKRTMFFLLVPVIYVIHTLNSSQVVLKIKRTLLNEIHDKSISSLILFIGGAFFFWSATNLGSRP